MSPAIGIALFVIGVGALLLSIVLDPRPLSRDPTPDAAADGGSEPPDEEPAAPAPEVAMVAEPGLAPEAPEPATSVPAAAAVETAVGHLEPAPSDRAAAAEARLEKLRAEFAGRGAPAMPAAPQPPASSEPPPISEPSARPDAGRVFAAVVSVGRDPQEEGPGPPGAAEPEPTALLEPEPVAPEPPGEREGVTGSEPTAGVEHGHAIPIVSHSDLVSHLRREHPDVQSGGSTIQMRRLHDGVHAS